MVKFALLVTLEAKPGKEKEVEEFLAAALSLVDAEPEMVTWYAFKIGFSKFGIFDSFASEEGREAHLAGEIAATLMDKAPDLFIKYPKIEHLDVLAVRELNIDESLEKSNALYKA